MQVRNIFAIHSDKLRMKIAHLSNIHQRRRLSKKKVSVFDQTTAVFLSPPSWEVPGGFQSCSHQRFHPFNRRFHSKTIPGLICVANVRLREIYDEGITYKSQLTMISPPLKSLLIRRVQGKLERVLVQSVANWDHLAFQRGEKLPPKWRALAFQHKVNVEFWTLRIKALHLSDEAALIPEVGRSFKDAMDNLMH